MNIEMQPLGRRARRFTYREITSDMERQLREYQEQVQTQGWMVSRQRTADAIILYVYMPEDIPAVVCDRTSFGYTKRF